MQLGLRYPSERSIQQGGIISAIGGAIAAVISAIAACVMAVVGGITGVRLFPLAMMLCVKPNLTNCPLDCTTGFVGDLEFHH